MNSKAYTQKRKKQRQKERNNEKEERKKRKGNFRIIPSATQGSPSVEKKKKMDVAALKIEH